MSSDREQLFEFDAAFDGAVEVRHQIFVADDSGYAVLEVRDDSGDNFILIGSVAHLTEGARAHVVGEWQEHSRYGHQLKATSALPLDPTDRAGQVAYLTTLRHIGPARAEQLVDVHGENVLTDIAADPMAVFSSLKGVSRRHAEAASESWHASRAVRDLHVQLAPHGLAHLAAPIHTKYGPDAMRVLRENPYGLTEIPGVGFTRADTIALAADVPRESDQRAHAAAVYALSEAERDGHTNLPVGELVSRAAKLLGLDPEPDVLVSAPGVMLDNDRAYRHATHDREIWCAETLASRASAPPRLDHEVSPPVDDDLTEEQWHAVQEAFSSRLSVVTGGPGVGKTVCIRAIVAEARLANVKIALCAPTGRAARRMEEATGHKAETLHRMLEWRPGSDPKFFPGHPIPVELVVVDESSMLNLRLIEVLLGGLAESTHIVFVGDADQLPPVGAGKPFADLIESETVPITRLTHIFRQAARSMITTAAHAINHGELPGLEPAPDQEHDFFFMDRPMPEKALETVVDLVAERVPEGLGLDPIRDVQVLAPMYRTAVGIDVLNERLQARVNPDGKPAVEQRFRIGDRLIQTRNSHELGLMNGSICFLVADDPNEEAIVIDTDDGNSLVVSYEEAQTLRLAYAISVHKAQGCEVPVVVFVCHRSHSRMLTRPLVYTAITRARCRCVLVGDQAALAMAVRRDEGSSRHSTLAERLRQQVRQISL